LQITIPPTPLEQKHPPLEDELDDELELLEVVEPPEEDMQIKL